MNLQFDRKSSRQGAEESRRLWQDGRVWWVNCVALEAAWAGLFSGQAEMVAARQRRDEMLAAFIGVW